EKANIMENLLTISNMVSEDGNMFFSGCYADTGGGLGRQLSSKVTNVNFYFSGDECLAPSYNKRTGEELKTSFSQFIQEPRIQNSKFTNGFSKYKGGER